MRNQVDLNRIKDIASRAFGNPGHKEGKDDAESGIEYGVALEIAQRHCTIDAGEYQERNYYGPDYAFRRLVSARFTHNDTPLRIAIDNEPRYLSEGAFREDDFIDVVKVLAIQDQGDGEELHSVIGSMGPYGASTVAGSPENMLNDVMDLFVKANELFEDNSESKRPNFLRRLGSAAVNHLRN